MAIPFDRHTFITDLIEQGFTAAQAEAIATGVQESTHSTHVTKSDFELAMQKIDARFERIATEFTWLRWTGGPMLLAILVLVINLVLRK